MGLREATFSPFRIISSKINASTTENNHSFLFSFYFSPSYLSELNIFSISQVVVFFLKELGKCLKTIHELKNS